MQCDNEGNPVLSGSLIRGNIRHALEEFDSLIESPELNPYINTWFGKKSGANGDQTHLGRANIEFDFFWTLITEINKDKPKPKPNQIKTRISIDETGKTQAGALQIIEDRFPTGSGNITFTGNIVAHIHGNEEQADFEKWINKALYYIPAMASFKGIGFGKIQNHQLTEDVNPQKNTQNAPQLTAGNTRLNMRLKLDRPFCIGRPKTPQSNRITSSEYIAGNVIKGVISRAYNQAYNDASKILKAHLSFDELIISHAMPANIKSSNKTKRHNKPPLSLGIVGDKIIDLAYTQNTKHWQTAPSFAPDWKQTDKQKINQYCDIQTEAPQRYLSVKTGINATQGTSETGQLFSLDCVDPTGFEWNAHIELCNIAKEKRQTVVNHLQALFNNGLLGIGKTKANASVTLQIIESTSTQKVCPHDDNITIIDLISDAKMLPAGLQISSINSAKKLHEHYQAYFQQIDADIKLERYFASQKLTSSYHHQKRYKQGKYYQPDYVSNAGSVFVLKLNSQQAKDKLTHCLKTGLPAHNNADGSKATWQQTPYLSEHGYGEICLHKPAEAKTGAKI